jgi:hypothetical protein
MSREKRQRSSGCLGQAWFEKVFRRGSRWLARKPAAYTSAVGTAATCRRTTAPNTIMATAEKRVMVL